jgi:tyrosyl-tRNA synthetase
VGADLPVLDLPAEGMTIAAACTAIGFTASNGEAKRKITEGALWLDEAKVTDANAPASPGRLRLGKKKFAILR